MNPENDFELESYFVFDEHVHNIIASIRLLFQLTAVAIGHVALETSMDGVTIGSCTPAPFWRTALFLYVLVIMTVTLRPVAVIKISMFYCPIVKLLYVTFLCVPGI